MRSPPIPIVVFALLSLTIAGLTAYYLPMLPDQVATHFDSGGRADAWHNHADFIKFIAIVIAVAAAFFLGGDLLVRLPKSLINLPNKDFWFAPERRPDTLAFMRGWFRWLVVLTLALVAVLVGMALRANLTAPPHFSDYAPWVLGTYLLLIAAMIILLLWRFRASTD